MDLSVEYAGLDLIEKAHSWEFNISCEPIEDFNRSFIAGPKRWSFAFRTGRGIPTKGQVKMVGLMPGPADDFCADGSACIAKGIMVSDDFGMNIGDVFEYLLEPLDAPLRYPAEEQRRVGIETAKEELNRHQELERTRKIATWKSVDGAWTVKGVRYGTQYQETYESMSVAIFSAITDAEWNYACPESIWWENQQIFDRTDIIALMDYEAEAGG